MAITRYKKNDGSAWPLRVALVLILCAAGGCRGDKVRISSNTDQWDQQEILLAAPIAALEAETLSENWIAQWSPDSSRFAWTTSRDDEDILNIYSLDTQKTQQIELGGRVAPLAFDWHPRGDRIAVGVYKHTRTMLMSNYPEFAEWIREYDLKTGSMLRSLGKDELGDFPTWARYSPDGKTLVVNIVGDFGPLTRSNIQNILGKVVSSKATLLVQDDGSVTTLSTGLSTFLTPQWAPDGTALLHKTIEYHTVSFFGLYEHDIGWNELTYHPISEEASPKLIAKLPRDFSMYIAYPGDGGLLRYAKYKKSNDGDSVSNWELWDYIFTTEQTEKLLDLKKLFTPIYSEKLQYGSITYLPENPNWCLARVGVIGKEQADYWYVSLDGSKRLRRLTPNDVDSGVVLPSPNGRFVAFQDESNMIKIVDLSEDLESPQK